MFSNWTGGSRAGNLGREWQAAAVPFLQNCLNWKSRGVEWGVAPSANQCPSSLDCPLAAFRLYATGHWSVDA